MLIAPEIGFENQMNTAKADQPISAFQALALRYLIATMTALFAVALALAFVPRQVFQGESLMGLSNLITAHWPKLETDRLSLQRINPGFADKFVISYTVLAAVAALMLVVQSLHLLAKAIREGAELKGSSIDTKFFLSVAAIILLIGWWSLFFPTPFMDSAGFSTKFPRWEMALIYSALFLFGLWMGLALFATAAIALIFGSQSNHSARGD